MSKEWFKKYAEEKREQLRGSRSSTDLFVNEEVGVAIIGVQNSMERHGNDSIYLLRVKDWEEKKTSFSLMLWESFNSGRMFPTGISPDGKSFTYRIKTDRGEIQDHCFAFD